MKPIEIIARCKIVTPMLSSGADQQEFEIRAAEVKAGLRFWWRAFQPWETQQLFKKEGELFGSTQTAAPFRIHVRYSDSSIPKWMPDQPHGWGQGLQYFLFPINKPELKALNGGHGRPPRPFSPSKIKPGLEGRTVVKPGGIFEISIIFPSVSSVDQRVMDVLWCLWLLENFGGLGGRTRRGCGCFEITDIKINDKSLTAEFEKMNAPQFFMNEGQEPKDFILKELSAVMELWKTQERTSSPPYSAFYQGLSEIWVLSDPKTGSHGQAVDTLEALGLHMKNFRLRNPSDEAKAMHQALEEGRRPPSSSLKGAKGYMGLPIIYNFKQDFGRIQGPNLRQNDRNLQYMLTSAKRKSINNHAMEEGCGRRSSPVLISCHQKGIKPYAVICYFPAPILPPEEKMWFKANIGRGNLDVFCDPPSHTNESSPGRKYASGLLNSLYSHFKKGACIK